MWVRFFRHHLSQLILCSCFTFLRETPPCSRSECPRWCTSFPCVLYTKRSHPAGAILVPLFHDTSAVTLGCLLACPCHCQNADSAVLALFLSAPLLSHFNVRFGFRDSILKKQFAGGIGVSFQLSHARSRYASFPEVSAPRSPAVCAR